MHEEPPCTHMFRHSTQHCSKCASWDLTHRSDYMIILCDQPEGHTLTFMASRNYPNAFSCQENINAFVILPIPTNEDECLNNIKAIVLHSVCIVENLKSIAYHSACYHSWKRIFHLFHDCATWSVVQTPNDIRHMPKPWMFFRIFKSKLPLATAQIKLFA